MKKICAITLSLMLTIIGMPTFAYANDSSEPMDISDTTVSKEYSVMKELAKESEAQLEREGFTKAEITEIKDYRQRYIEHIEKLDELDDEVLYDFGYSEEQIEMIRDFKGSEAELYALSATLSLRVRIATFEYDKSQPLESRYTKGTFEFGWEWDGKPLAQSNDIVAVGWNGWSITSRSSSIRYFDMTSHAYKENRSGTKISPSSASGGIGGAGYKFPVVPTSSNLFAKNGQVTFKLKSDVHAMKDFYYYVAYGHTQLTVSPSFSVSANGITPAVVFNSGVKELSPKNGKIVPKAV